MPSITSKMQRHVSLQSGTDIWIECELKIHRRFSKSDNQIVKPKAGMQGRRVHHCDAFPCIYSRRCDPSQFHKTQTNRSQSHNISGLSTLGISLKKNKKTSENRTGRKNRSTTNCWERSFQWASAWPVVSRAGMPRRCRVTQLGGKHGTPWRERCRGAFCRKCCCHCCCCCCCCGCGCGGGGGGGGGGALQHWWSSADSNWTGLGKGDVNIGKREGKRSMKEVAYHFWLLILVKVKSNLFVSYRRNAGQHICKMNQMWVLKVQRLMEEVIETHGSCDRMVGCCTFQVASIKRSEDPLVWGREWSQS